jgi:hypothetical protein
MKTKSRKQAWFKKVRGSYLPNSKEGLVIYFAYLVYLVAVPVVWYGQGHDLWRLLTTVVPLTVGAAVLTQFIASKNYK